MQKRLVALSLLSGVVAFILVAMPVSAQQGEERSTDSTTQQGANERKEQAKIKTEQQQQRLTAAKQRVCEQREAKINAIMDRRTAQAQKHLEVFNKIYARTTAFYESKGNVAANYDSLIALVDAANVKAEASIAALKATPDFSCDDQSPKEVTDAYKTAYKAMREDVKAFKAALKDLIVAVKRAQGGLES